MIIEFVVSNGWRETKVTLLVVEDKKYLLREGRYVLLDKATIDGIDWYPIADAYNIDSTSFAKLGKWLLDDRSIKYLTSTDKAENALGLMETPQVSIQLIERCLEAWSKQADSVPVPVPTNDTTEVSF